MKRYISILLVLCLAIPTAFAEEEKPKSVWDSIGGWFSQAAEDTADWAWLIKMKTLNNDEDSIQIE